MIQKNYLHVLWRLPSLILWMMVMPSLYFLASFLRIPNYQVLPHIFHRGVRRILGLKVNFSGALCEHKPVIYISNHISYLDVFVLGDIRAFFVAKSEVSGWPILGQFAKFQNTLYVERKASKAKSAMLMMQSHLKQDNSLIFFPEGTSTKGVSVESFKSSLFEAANIDKSVMIQPVTIAYTHQGGKKMNQAVRDYYAWYAEMPFASHFFHLFALKQCQVNVFFHPVRKLADYPTRKDCADDCQKIVARKLKELNQLD